MKLYNTLTKKIDEIVPLHQDNIGVYTCGPTVYDYAHVGHWFNYVRMDTLIRTLNASGLSTKWVMNITDVGHLVSDADDGEDKLEKGAKREGKTAWEIAEFYTADFLQGMELLQISKPDHIVKATEHITEQIALIKKLEDKDYTYVIDDGVYYDTAKFPGYASFAEQDLDDSQAEGRIQMNPQKKNHTDFALWKFSPANIKRDMEWDSPWGKGFPGWHIECSAMSMKYLGESFDIHTGGIDHVPVHHTNEIAQSEAATGKRLAQYWMHSNHLNINGEKISKSKGNGITLQHIAEKKIDPLALRLHVHESHYRTHASFSWKSLRAAGNRLTNYRAMAVLRYQPHDGTNSDPRSQISMINGAKKEILAALSNDLNTPRVLRTLSVLEGTITETLLHSGAVEVFNDFLKFIDKVLGLDLSHSPDITSKQKALLMQRMEARALSDWDSSDTLRSSLEDQGIIVRDLPGNKQIWYRL